MRSLALNLGRDKEINASIPLLKRRRGYAESDHIIAVAFNPLHGRQTLDDVRSMRRDTDFSQTKFLDAWDDQPDVSFEFRMDAHPALV